MRKIVIALVGVFVLAHAAQLGAQSLKGSRATMRKQNSIARQQEEYTFLRTTHDVRRFIENGLLVPVRSTHSLLLSEGVSYPYARPAVKTFAERIAGQYKEGCGERMVVTSLTRPLSKQPWNASNLSVHPAGMALDIRVSDRRGCQRWLEEVLVGLERKGVIDATREYFPAHFHVAVFPTAYENYLARSGASQTATRVASKASLSSTTSSKLKIAIVDQSSYASVVPTSSSRSQKHKVRSGESLWSIAKQHHVAVVALKNANDLRGSRIRPGQVLAIPRARSSEAD